MVCFFKDKLGTILFLSPTLKSFYKMVTADQIKNHVAVVGTDGAHVGTVDHMAGEDRIKLTKHDEDADGRHHYIPLGWVASADDKQVKLNKTAQEAQDQWQGE